MAQKAGAGPPRGARAGDTLMVILIPDDFDARSADELTLRKGDRIELVELDDGFGDGWYLGKHLSHGSTGLFPGGISKALIQGQRPPPVAQPNLQATKSASHASKNSISSQDATPQPSRHPSTVGPSKGDSVNQGQVATQSPAADVSRSNSVRASSASSIPPIQRSISETIGTSKSGDDSPVMNETLSVIDEHITDLSTPRHSVLKADLQVPNDSASEYSSHVEGRLSFLEGPETDEEDGRLTELEVKHWDHKQTAKHLRQLGVEEKHCDIFEEQEISGEVLLEMDQNFIFMKEMDFGVMGRRLKTWHKIRALQEEVKGPARYTRKGSSAHSGQGGSMDGSEPSQHRVPGGALLPRIPSIHQHSGSGYKPIRANTMSHFESTGLEKAISNIHTQYPPSTSSTTSSRPNAGSPLSPWRPTGPESPSRPSAASIREMHHSRRHSSIDVTNSPQIDSAKSSANNLQAGAAHKKQSSFDRNWSMTSAGHSLIAPAFNSLYSSTGSLRHNRAPSGGTQITSITPGSPPQGLSDDLERGYFSGPEVDNRKTRNVLKKRDSAVSPSHSRQSSILEESRRSITAMKRQSRFGSADSIRDIVPLVTSPASKAYHSHNSIKGRFRSNSIKSQTGASKSGSSPTVTNLEGTAPASPKTDSERSGPSSPLNSITDKVNASRRAMGLRAISDAVTGTEKAYVASPSSIPSPIKENLQSPTRSSSTTPSQNSKSMDNDNADSSSKNTESASIPLASGQPHRNRTKSKKETSAYIRGLEKKTPAEQREGCDYSGWMKKKSKGVMATWKPRLFVLRGRRLSYYYSEDDTEEKGVIDVSHHRVLRADTDPLTTLHATITGAASSPTFHNGEKSNATNAENSGQPLSATSKAQNRSVDAPFYFKLVPPRAGLPRAVQFTKPATHYFQCENLAEGRRWMGELLKATIERDTNQGVDTTNKQKTITLAMARARKERPPALMSDETAEIVITGPKSDGDTGLNILGMNFDHIGGEDHANGITHKKMNSLDVATTNIDRPPSAQSMGKENIRSMTNDT
ncbi:MAG: hypothetical protein Q9227_000315 [Pyrenula ochraceoflavens]